MVWNKLGTTTLGSAGDDLDITSMTASKFNMIMNHWISITSTTTASLTLDNTGGNDYAYRYSTNGGSDSISVSQANVQVGLGGIPSGSSNFDINYSVNIDGKEKLIIGHNITSATAGAGTSPSRRESVYKKDTTTDSGQYTRIDYNNADAGSFDTDSNLSVIGSDGTEETKLQDGAIYYETDTNKEFILSNNIWTEL